MFNSSQKARRVREITGKGTIAKHESTATLSLADFCLENKILQSENVQRNTKHMRLNILNTREAWERMTEGRYTIGHTTSKETVKGAGRESNT